MWKGLLKRVALLSLSGFSSWLLYHYSVHLKNRLRVVKECRLTRRCGLPRLLPNGQELVTILCPEETFLFNPSYFKGYNDPFWPNLRYAILGKISRWEKAGAITSITLQRFSLITGDVKLLATFSNVTLSVLNHWLIRVCAAANFKSKLILLVEFMRKIADNAFVPVMCVWEFQMNDEFGACEFRQHSINHLFDPIFWQTTYSYDYVLGWKEDGTLVIVVNVTEWDHQRGQSLFVFNLKKVNGFWREIQSQKFLQSPLVIENFKSAQVYNEYLCFATYANFLLFHLDQQIFIWIQRHEWSTFFTSVYNEIPSSEFFVSRWDHLGSKLEIYRNRLAPDRLFTLAAKTVVSLMDKMELELSKSNFVISLNGEILNCNIHTVQSFGLPPSLACEVFNSPNRVSRSLLLRVSSSALLAFVFSGYTTYTLVKDFYSFLH